jgi:F-type H+-transporting ATPase subunit gamma
MSLQDMKRQIQSVDNTAKMTGAMQTISAVKLSRARERLDRIRPYTDNMQQMMQDIASRGRGRQPAPGRSGRGPQRRRSAPSPPIGV